MIHSNQAAFSADQNWPTILISGSRFEFFRPVSSYRQYTTGVYGSLLVLKKQETRPFGMGFR
jgi:hypothetical protein